jgi:tellurite methyltransferase
MDTRRLKMKKFWDEKWSAIDISLTRTVFAKKAFETIKNKKFKTVLDIACGDGKDSVYFSKKGYEVTALDISYEALKKLKQRKNSESIKTVQKDILEFNPKQKFDVIYCNLGLHYFDDKTTRKIFEKIYKLLNKGGYLFVRVKSDKDSYYKKGKEISENYYKFEGKKIHLFSKQYLKEMLSDFKILKLRRTSSKQKQMSSKTIFSSFVYGIAKK